MNQSILQYISLLEKEIKEKIGNDFNLEKSLFADFQTFDFANFFLIYNYILDDNLNKKDFFIGIPEKKIRPNFFSSILHSLTLVKLYQNFFNYQKTIPILDLGDLIYTKRNKETRILEVKKVVNEQVYLNLKFPKRNESGINDFTLTKNIFTKLNPAFVENKNTVKNIDNYRQFLNDYLVKDCPLITDFQNKTLVIAEKGFFVESGFLPIKYTTKSGVTSNKLPFFNYMIDCCNDFQTAKKFLTNSSEQFDEVVIIGDSKYRETFSDILQELKWQERVNNIILIGSQKPASNSDFIEWLWSKDEMKIANNETPQHIQKQIIENNLLLEKLIELKSEIELLKTEKGVDISFVLKYTNFYFRNIITDTPLSKGTYQEYCDRLLSYFKSEKFEEELNSQFYNQDIYSPDAIKESTKKTLKKFQEISSIIETQNHKWDFIKKRAKELGNSKLYLIADRKSYSILCNQIKSNKISNIKLISEKRIDNQIDYLQQWINSDEKNTENRNYIIPYLNSVEMFDVLSQLKGNCEVLCYKDIDEIAFDNLIRNFHVQEKSRLTHKDRKEFVSSIFSEDIQYLQRQLDNLFKFDFNNESFKNNPYESIDLPKEKIQYEIEFTDGSVDKFDSSKGIFLIDGSEQINTTIGEVFEGATIRFYQNNNPTEFKKILKIFDEENKLELFDTYSNSWKLTLQRLSQKFDSKENLFSNMFNDIHRIHFGTFRYYFDEKCTIRFPRKKTLEAIKKLCIEKEMTNELLVTEFDKFITYSKKDSSIRQQAGRIIGNDLIEYEASGKTEKSESLQKLPDIILKKLLETVQTKTIKKKTLLEYEE
jgi:hypothetical protein